MPLIGRVARLTLDLVFPPQCALCGRGGTLLCSACAASLPAADGVRCERCWLPLPDAAGCRHCREFPSAFGALRAAYVLEGGARRLAHLLKYEGLTSVAEPMAALMPLAADPAVDLVVPVPLHPRRERSRGYNQSALLARHIARERGLALDTGALRRVRATAPLTKTMHAAQRRATVAGAFAADARRVEGRHVLLVDDVATTGATLDAAARALLAAEAASVRCQTWARAD